MNGNRPVTVSVDTMALNAAFLVNGLPMLQMQFKIEVIFSITDQQWFSSCARMLFDDLVQLCLKFFVRKLPDKFAGLPANGFRTFTASDAACQQRQGSGQDWF